MRNICLATMVTLATLTLVGCGSDTPTTSPVAFELDGKWLYLGPSGKAHTIQISDASMAYADVDGEWSSSWSVKQYDKGQHHFQIVFKSGNGTYYPAGPNMSGTYVLNSGMLTVQVASGLGSYPTVQSPGSCMAGSAPISDCGIYMIQQ
jgi:hypothetical protein